MFFSWQMFVQLTGFVFFSFQISNVTRIAVLELIQQNRIAVFRQLIVASVLACIEAALSQMAIADSKTFRCAADKLNQFELHRHVRRAAYKTSQFDRCATTLFKVFDSSNRI